MLSLLLAQNAADLPANSFDVPPSYWIAFCVGTAVLLMLDMFVFHRHAHEPTLRESAMWTVFWCSLALVFNAWVWWWADARARHRVLHRLPRRVVVVDGQRVRVRGDLRVLRRAAEVSVSRAVLGHPGRDRDAADVHSRRQPAARALRMDFLLLRRVSDLHGHQAGHGPRRARRNPDQNIVLRLARRVSAAWPRDRTATSSSSARTASCSSRRCFWCCW